MLERRAFLTGIVSAVVAPAVVQASTLMPVLDIARADERAILRSAQRVLPHYIRAFSAKTEIDNERRLEIGFKNLIGGRIGFVGGPVYPWPGMERQAEYFGRLVADSHRYGHHLI